MMRRAPPLRFLALVIGTWVGIRAAMLLPWGAEKVSATPVTRERVAEVARTAEQAALPSPRVDAAQTPPQWPTPPRGSGGPQMVFQTATPSSAVHGEQASERLSPVAPGFPGPTPLLPALGARADRWSGSAWLFVRGGSGAPAAPGGTLGGSQAGLRLAWRINRDAARPLAISARLYTPLGGGSGAGAGLGLDWQPLARLPVHILAERRLALGDNGRSAFALTLYGGVSGRPLRGSLRLDAYAQAGAVGARSRDLFADAAARVTAPVGSLDLGAGLWGGAQPGVARLDAGPHVSLRLPFAGERLRVSAEWRFRIAGGAGPGSGPVLTVGGDF